MNLRLFLFRLLLSCVLLGTQQMGLTHALSHLRGAAGANAGAGGSQAAGTLRGAATAAAASAAARAIVTAGDPARAVRDRTGTLQADKACEQCLAFAQIDAALAACILGLPPLPAPATKLPPPLHAGLLPVTACAFQSRAPPFLA